MDSFVHYNKVDFIIVYYFCLIIRWLYLQVYLLIRNSNTLAGLRMFYVQNSLIPRASDRITTAFLIQNGVNSMTSDSLQRLCTLLFLRLKYLTKKNSYYIQSGIKILFNKFPY